MLDCSLIMLKNIKVIKLIGQFISGNGEFMFWLKNYESCKTVAHNIWDTFHELETKWSLKLKSPLISALHYADCFKAATK